MAIGIFEQSFGFSPIVRRHCKFASKPVGSYIKFSHTDPPKAPLHHILSLTLFFFQVSMDRTQILLVGLPIFLFFSDILNLFSPQPSPKPTHHHLPPIHPKPHPQPHLQQPLEFPTQVSRLPSSKFTILNPFLVPIFVLLSGFLLTVFFLFNFVQKQSGIGLIGIGNTVSIDFCTSCSYKFVQFLAFFQFRSNCLI